MNYKIAILMATYNGEKFIKEQLDSIFSQTIGENDITLIIRDDGSSDNTLSIIKQYSDNYKILIINDLENNIGPARSFWRLLKYADGYDYYMFSDQDDIWDHDKIISSIKKAENYEEAFLYTSNSRKINTMGNCINLKCAKDMPKYNLKSVLVSSFAQGCSMLFNNKAREFALMQDEDVIPMHDLALLISTIINGTVYYDLRPRFSHRVHESNADAVNNQISFIHRMVKSLKKWKVRSDKSALDKYALDIIKNYGKELDKDNMNFLNLLSNYKTSCFTKSKLLIWLFFEDKYSAWKSKRSFAIRIVCNLL